MKSTPASEWDPDALWNPRQREGDILRVTDKVTAERVKETRGGVQRLELCQQDEAAARRKIKEERMVSFLCFPLHRWGENSAGNYSKSCTALGWRDLAELAGSLWKASICCWMLGVSGPLISISRGRRGEEGKAEIQQAAAESIRNRDGESQQASAPTDQSRPIRALWVLMPPSTRGTLFSSNPQKTTFTQTEPHAEQTRNDELTNWLVDQKKFDTW